MAWRGAICFPMSGTGKADFSIIALRIHTDRPDGENDRFQQRDKICSRALLAAKQHHHGNIRLGGNDEA